MEMEAVARVPRVEVGERNALGRHANTLPMTEGQATGKPGGKTWGPAQVRRGGSEGGSYEITLPKHLIESLEWKIGDGLVCKIDGKEIRLINTARDKPLRVGDEILSLDLAEDEEE